MPRHGAVTFDAERPPVGGKPGPKRERPEHLQGDRGYYSEPLRVVLRWLGSRPSLPDATQSTAVDWVSNAGS